MSFDVISLYTSIEHEFGIGCVGRALNNTLFSDQSKEFLIGLLEIILTCNYFRFEGEFFIQQKGTAMGSNVAPTYANIVMADLEEQRIYTSHHFRSVLKWWRYIDDVFAIWSDTTETLEEFFSFLNTIERSIKFTMTWSRESIQFLDTLVYIEDGKLKTDLFVKNTDRNNLLQFKSLHPRGMLESLPYSQLLRIKRIVDDPRKYNRRKYEMGRKFLDRGYPKKLIEGHIQKVDELDEDNTLQKKVTVSKSNRIPFVSTYNQISTQVSKIIWMIMVFMY